jgi:hypothetical protein
MLNKEKQMEKFDIKKYRSAGRPKFEWEKHWQTGEPVRYATPRASLFHGIPVKHRDEVLRLMRGAGIAVHLFYRGSRKNKKYNRQSMCDRANAETFAVYLR